MVFKNSNNFVINQSISTANQTEKISSVKLVGCNRSYIILHLNHNTLLVLHMYEHILRVKSVIRTEDAKAKIIAATLYNDWIFFLESTNRVRILMNYLTVCFNCSFFFLTFTSNIQHGWGTAWNN